MTESEVVERQLIARALDKDREALEGLLLCRFEWLTHVIEGEVPVGLRTGPIDVKEVMQDAVAKIFRGFPSFTPRGGEESLFGWMKAVTQNAARDAVRRQRKLRESPLSSFSPVYDDGEVDEHIAQRIVSNDPRASVVAQGQELTSAFRAALAELPEKYRQVINLLYMQDLTVEEVAKRMETTPGAIRGLRDRAREEIRKSLIRLSNFI